MVISTNDSSVPPFFRPNSKLQLPLHNVTDGKAKAKQSAESIDVGDLPHSPFSGDDASAVTQVTTTTVFIPTNQQFPFVDFLVVKSDGSVTGIQSTVNRRDRKPSPSTASKVIEKLGKGLKLSRIVWAVPSGGITQKQPLDESKVTATKAFAKKYNEIPQYLLIVD